MKRIFFKILCAAALIFSVSGVNAQETEFNSVISWIMRMYPDAEIDDTSMYILNGIVSEEISADLDRENSAGNSISYIGYLPGNTAYERVYTNRRIPSSIIVITTYRMKKKNIQESLEDFNNNREDYLGIEIDDVRIEGHACNGIMDNLKLRKVYGTQVIKLSSTGTGDNPQNLLVIRLKSKRHK